MEIPAGVRVCLVANKGNRTRLMSDRRAPTQTHGGRAEAAQQAATVKDLVDPAGFSVRSPTLCVATTPLPSES